MGQIQFRGLRNVGQLFGILDAKSSPSQLNTEDGVSLTYSTNEAIQETLGRTYKFHATQVSLAANTSAITPFNPWSSAPSIPEEFRANCYLINAGFHITGSATSFLRATLSLLVANGDFLLQDPLGGQIAIAVYDKRSAAATAISLLIGSTGTVSPWCIPLPLKLPSTGLESGGAGNELRLSTDKNTGGADMTIECYLDFWAAPIGVQCPWI